MTDSEWQVVTDVLKGQCPSISAETLDDVRGKLEDAVWSYRDTSATRSKMAHAVAERDGWAEIQNMTLLLSQQVKQRSHWIAPVWGEAPELESVETSQKTSVLQALALLHQTAHENADTYSSYVWGKSKPHVELLYEAVFRVWTDQLNQELKISNDPKQTVYGPLWRFFAAVIGPVRGTEVPKASSFKDIVKREKIRRRGS